MQNFNTPGQPHIVVGSNVAFAVRTVKETKEANEKLRLVTRSAIEALYDISQIVVDEWGEVWDKPFVDKFVDVPLSLFADVRAHADMYDAMAREVYPQGV